MGHMMTSVAWQISLLTNHRAEGKPSAHGNARGRERVEERDVWGNVHLGRLVDPGKRRSCDQGHIRDIRDGTTRLMRSETSDVDMNVFSYQGVGGWRGRIL